MLRLYRAILAPTVFAACFFACDDETGSPPVDYGSLIRATTDSVIVPEHAAFVARADELATATQGLEATPSADSLAKAQAAWRAARAAYRALDAVHFGPIAELGIAERIDVSPANPADIDTIIAQNAPVDVASVGAAGGKTKGFLGLEYLLFSSTGAEAALARLQGDDAPATRRRALARAVAAEIAASAHQVDDAWSPGKGGFANELTSAGKSSARYASQRAALDDMVGGVGYALEVVVGVRLALVLGRKSGGTPDPNQDCTRASDNAVADLTATIEGVRAVYRDNGFSSRVRAKSAALDQRVFAELAACTSNIAAIPPPFAETLTKNVAVVQAAYSACKDLKATWNTEVTSALGATLKPSDNDGD